MGGRGRQKKKDPPPKGETIKEQAEAMKLVARDLNQMGFEVEELRQMHPNLEDTKGDSKGTLLKLATSGLVSEIVNQYSLVQDLKKSDVVSTTSSSGIAISPSARSIGVIEKEKEDFQPSLKQKPLRSWASVVEGNRGIRKGWDLQCVKPHNPIGVMVITKDEWVKGSKIWENALVGYVLGLRPTFKDMANFVNNRWKEFQVPKAFLLRNGVFLFDFANGDAKQATLEKRWTFNGDPLILKQWTLDFDLDNLDIIKKQRVAYARMLVETKIMDTPPRVVPVVGPKGVFQQPVVFEWEPTRCGKCRNLGMKRGIVKLRKKRGEVQTGANSSNMKQSTLIHVAGKMIVGSNEKCLVQLGVGVLRQGNL
ncbi:hypothetical protein SLEP1_g6756 [Rubroshorea leprosula]|uniref:DUF4283 domain-containing protein n=1 Tax=Rubroshorea leprosula TaxID=152421 RepID=A0AAV5I0T5_9ROSI|nr:hypothetical protein SLEP1_g6756 [Rubroshorea leprosula]